MPIEYSNPSGNYDPRTNHPQTQRPEDMPQRGTLDIHNTTQGPLPRRGEQINPPLNTVRFFSGKTQIHRFV